MYLELPVAQYAITKYCKVNILNWMLCNTYLTAREGKVHRAERLCETLYARAKSAGVPPLRLFQNEDFSERK